ncbi:MAG TPA: hypothetical protein VH107_05925 [Lacipirellulaceae bacterium]|nr:hypothetical protein [Lacipirellulaceae bacterium]
MTKFLLFPATLVLLISGVAFGDISKPDTSNLPIDTAYTYEMPVGKNLGGEKETRSLAELIQQTLMRKRGEKSAGSGFAVEGDLVTALRKSLDVLKSDAPAANEVKSDQPWLFFFTRNSGQFVHLESIKQTGTEFTIRFRFVPHDTKELTRHFALIPLSGLHPGKYKVLLAPCPYDDASIKEGYQPPSEATIEKTVCRPFEFTVK